RRQRPLLRGGVHGGDQVVQSGAYLVQHLGDGGAVAAADGRPQPGVAGGDASHVPQALSGQGEGVVRGSGELGGGQGGHQLREVGDDGHGCVVFGGGQGGPRGAQVHGQGPGGTDGRGGGSNVGGAHRGE